METLNNFFQILIKDWILFPENPEIVDYAIYGMLAACLLLLIFFIIKLLIMTLKGLYGIIDTIGVPLREGSGKIINKIIVQGFQFYTRTGPITIPDRFVLQIEMENKITETSFSEEYFQSAKINQKVKTFYYIGRLSKEVFIKEIKE